MPLILFMFKLDEFLTPIVRFDSFLEFFSIIILVNLFLCSLNFLSKCIVLQSTLTNFLFL